MSGGAVNDKLQSGFRIGDWEVYPQENLLKGPDRTRVLEPKVMDVLVFLAGRQGDVVSRRQLLDSVWADVVVGDEVVSRAISVLRTELGDDHTNSRYLKTISKRGYRLIADVIPLASEGPQQVASASDASASATPEHPSESITHFALRKLDFIIIGMLLVVLAYFVADKFVLAPGATLEPVQSTAEPPQSPDSLPQASIAVLPFTNRSAQEDSQFFVDGVHGDLVTQLARIGDLKVISRTSVLEYRDTTKNMRQIGEELGVATLLEGAVQRAGNHVFGDRLCRTTTAVLV